ncbi:MAG: hypothetical protein LBK68_00780 [Candidatus Margulisbacteria bacterium]|jgi:hypothetical protein|nr:hypothetical protein [Candidatus Margulisiibacteriota bacterium]
MTDVVTGVNNNLNWPEIITNRQTPHIGGLNEDEWKNLLGFTTYVQEDHYDPYIQNIYDEITFLEQNYWQDEKYRSRLTQDLAEINQIISEATKPKTFNYSPRQCLSFCYAAISLNIVLGDKTGNTTYYNNARELLARFDVRHGNYVFRARNEEVTLASHTFDQSLWFVSLVGQLIERGVITPDTEKTNNIVGLLGNTIKTIGNNYINEKNEEKKAELYIRGRYFTAASLYLDAKLERTEATRAAKYKEIYDNLKKDGTSSPLLLVLRLTVLNSLLSTSLDADVVRDYGVDMAELERFFNWTLLPSANAIKQAPNTPRERAIKETDKSYLQAKYNSYVQYYMSRANYLRTAAQQAIKQIKSAANINTAINNAATAVKNFNDFLYVRVTNDLADRENSYFKDFLTSAKQEVEFLELDIVLTRAERGDTSVNLNSLMGRINSLTASTPGNNARRYYFRSRLFSLQIKREPNPERKNIIRRNALAFIIGGQTSDGKPIADNVLTADYNLNNIYRTNNAADNKNLQLNALCEAAELLMDLDRKSEAKDYYAILERPAVSNLTALLSVDPRTNRYAFQSADLNATSARVLFLAASLKDNKTLSEAIANRLIDVFGPAGSPKDETIFNGALALREGFRFDYVLDNLKALKKAGQWAEGLAKIDEEAALFAQNADNQRERAFQLAECNNLAYLYDNGSKPDLSNLAQYTNPASRQRLHYLRMAQLASDKATPSGKDLSGILREIGDLVRWDKNSQKLTFTLSSEYDVRLDTVNKDTQKSPKEYNDEFEFAVIAEYFETLNSILNSEEKTGLRPADPQSAAELTAAFRDYFDRQKARNVNSPSEQDLRFLFFAALLLDGDQSKPKDIYEKIIHCYPLPVPRGYAVSVNGVSQTYYYNSDAKRAYWEAQAGLVNYYAKQKNFAAQKTAFDRIETEYKNRINPQNVAGYAADAAYIKNLYFNALLMQCLSDLEQENRNTAVEHLGAWKTLLADPGIAGQLTPAKREQHKYTLIEMWTRAAMLLDTQEDQPQDALDELRKIYNDKEYNLSSAQNAAARLCADIIRGNIEGLIAADRQRTTGPRLTFTPDDTFNPDNISKNYFTKNLTVGAYTDLPLRYEKQLFISSLLNRAKLGDQQAVETLQALLAPARAEQTTAEVDKDFFSQIEPRLELDQAWNSLNDKYQGYRPAGINAENIAKKYLASPYSAGTHDEAKDLLRLAWSKGANPQWAVNGTTITIDNRPVPIKGYADLAGFTNKQARSAAENLLTLYGYTTATRDENKLAGLIKNILTPGVADEELCCKAQLAEAEQYLRLSGDPDAVKNLPAVLSALGFLSGARTDRYIRPAIEKALETTLDVLGDIFTENAESRTSDDYYTYCNQRIRYVLLQYENAPQNAYDALEKLSKPLNEGGLGLSGDSLTGKLLLDTITANRNTLLLENADKINGAAEKLNFVPQPQSDQDQKKILDEYLHIYDEDCATKFQKQLLIGILLLLAAQTRISGAEPAESGDDDAAEMAVEILLGLRPNDDPRKLTSAERLAETVEFMGQEYFDLLEPRLRLDYAWALLKPNNPSAAALNITERIARTIIEQGEKVTAKIISEAEDLLRLAWAKSKDSADGKPKPQWAVDGKNIGTDDQPVFIKGYAALIAEPTDFTDKRVNGAFENLISLYGYNPLTRDAESNKGKLAELVKQLQETYDSATFSPQLKPAVKKLYIKALLAQAETYYRDKNMIDMARALDLLLAKPTESTGDYSGLLSGEIGIPEKTEEYYAYCEQRVRLVLQQAQDNNKSKSAVETGNDLEILRGELNLISPEWLPTNLTEKLLNSFITVNKPNITPQETKDVMANLGFDITASREYFEKTCRTDYQRRLFIGILCKLADSTSDAPNTLTPDQRAKLLSDGDNDIYEQIVEDLLLDSQNQYRPTTFAQDLLSPEYAATILPRLRLGMAWRGLTGNDNESADQVISKDWLAVADGVVSVVDALCAVNLTLRKELQNEVDSLRYFVMIKNKDENKDTHIKKINEALTDYYLPQIADNPANMDARTLVLSAYAYDLQEYSVALSYIDENIRYTGENIRRDAALDPILFSTVVDCWSKQEPKTVIPEVRVRQYITAIQTQPELYASDKAKTALANIICAYVSQQLEDGNLDDISWLKNIILPSAEHSPGTRTYIEARIGKLKVDALIKEGRYEEALKLLQGTDKKSGVPLSGTAENGVVYTPVSFSLNRENATTGISAILTADTGPAAAVESDAKSGILQKLDSLETEYNGKLDSRLIVSLRNDVRRQQAQIKEAQGFYTEAVARLDEIDLSFIDDEKEKTQAQFYDDLQHARIFIKQEKFADAQSILETLPALADSAELKPDERCLIYFNLLDIALQNPEVALGYLAKLAELLSAENNDAPEKNIKPETVLLYDLQRVAARKLLQGQMPPDENMPTLEDVEQKINALPAGYKQQTYRNLLAELQAYEHLESRSYLQTGNGAIIAEFALPQTFEPADGLDSEEHALNMRKIYLDSQITAGGAAAANALTKMDADLESVETALKTTKSEGLQIVLQKYETELLFLKYSFLRTHSQYDASDKKIEGRLAEINERLDKSIKALKDLAPYSAVNVEERRENLRESSSDTPPYDLLETQIKEDLDYFYKENGKDIQPGQLEFWKFKKKLDDLLNNFVLLGDSPQASAEEIILAVDKLYDLRLGLVESGAVSGGQLLPKIEAFRAQMPAGFVFTGEEKGYGYYLILNLLEKDLAKFSQIAKKVYDAGYLSKNEPNDYYAQSSVLLIDLINTQLKNNAEFNTYIGANTLPQINYKPDGDNLVTKYGDMSLTTNLKKKIALVEDENSLAEDENSLNLPAEFKAWEKVYKKRISGALSGSYKYTAGKMLLDYLGALIRQRDEGRPVSGLTTVNKKIKLLFDFLNTLPSDNLFSDSHYYQLKIAALKIQYASSLLSKAVDARDWNTPAAGQPKPRKISDTLPDYLGQARDILEERLEHVASDSAEHKLCSYLLSVLNGEDQELPEISGLPEEAKYLYIELTSRLASALLAQQQSGIQRLGGVEKNKILSLTDTIKSWEPDHAGLPYLEQNIKNATQKLSLSLLDRLDLTSSENTSVWCSIDNQNVQLVKNGLFGSLASKTEKINLSKEVPIIWTPWNFLNLRATPGVDLQWLKSTDSISQQGLYEGLLFTKQETHSSETPFLEPIIVPKIGLGFDLIAPQGWLLGFWQPSLSGDVNYSYSPQQRSPYNASRFGEKNYWDHHWSFDVAFNNKFAVNKFFGFEINNALHWSLDNGMLATESYYYKEEKTLSGAFQYNPRGRVNFNFGELSTYLGGGLLFEQANNLNSGWQWADRFGWAAELGWSYYSPRWSGSVAGNFSILGKDINTGLNFRFTRPNWPTLLLGLNYTLLPKRITNSSQDITYDSGKHTLTNTTDTRSSQNNLSVSLSVEIPLSPFDKHNKK